MGSGLPLPTVCGPFTRVLHQPVKHLSCKSRLYLGFEIASQTNCCAAHVFFSFGICLPKLKNQAYATYVTCCMSVRYDHCMLLPTLLVDQKHENETEHLLCVGNCVGAFDLRVAGQRRAARRRDESMLTNEDEREGEQHLEHSNLELTPQDIPNFTEVIVIFSVPF